MNKNTAFENLKYPIGKFQKPEVISEADLKTWITTIENFPAKINKPTSTLSVKELNWVLLLKSFGTAELNRQFTNPASKNILFS